MTTIATSLTADELAALLIQEYREGQHSHYYLFDGIRRKPIELPEAHELRRAGVPADMPQTRPLAREDGE